MPYSDDAFNDLIASIIDAVRPATLCDIGPGAGKYAQIARETAQMNGFQIKLTGVEIDPAYVEQFKLRSLYDEVIIDDAIRLIGRMNVKYDFVIIGDVIEHFKKSDGIDLLNFLLYRTSYICVIFPTEYIQEGSRDHPREAHISTWGLNDFQGWKARYATSGFMNIILLKGFQPSPIESTEPSLDKIFWNTFMRKIICYTKKFLKFIIRFFYPGFRRDKPKTKLA